MNAGQGHRRVSAADFVRSFANWRMSAAREPVVVTHHGKDAHVLISLDDYRRLGGSGSGEVAESCDARLRDSQAALLESIRDALILVDQQRRILSINPAASDMLEIAAAALIGQPLVAALPAVETGPIFHHLLRMIDHRQRFAGELPSLLQPGQWLHIDLIPLPVGGAIVLRDVSDAIAARDQGDARQAAVQAIGVDGRIGHAHISVREDIAFANDALIRTLGVGVEAIRRVRFSVLLPVARRPAFADALESLFRTGVPVRLETELVARDGTTAPVMLSIVERRNAYASEGAVILITPR